MSQSDFMATFHAIWGEDSKNKNQKGSKYDKEAWMYVQGKADEYFKNLKRQSRNSR